MIVCALIQSLKRSDAEEKEEEESDRDLRRTHQPPPHILSKARIAALAFAAIMHDRCTSTVLPLSFLFYLCVSPLVLLPPPIWNQCVVVVDDGHQGINCY